MEEGTTIAEQPEAEETARRSMAARLYEPEPRRATIPAKVAVALVAAQRLVKRIAHDANNPHHKYRYTSAEAVIEHATAWLDKAGLALVQYGWRRESPRVESWAFVDASSKTVEVDESAPARLVILYALAHESGEVWDMPPVSIPVLPEKGRPLDKAEATALTYSLGYVLRGLLKIPRSDDGTDVNQRADDGGEDRDGHRSKGRVIAPSGRLGEVSSPEELAAWISVHGHKIARLDVKTRLTSVANLVKKAAEFGVSEDDVLGKLADLAPAPAPEPTPEEQRAILEAERTASEGVA